MNDDRIKYFTGKVVLITGGASGLGAALAGEISSCHARVLVLDNNQDGLEKLTHNNSLIRAYHADVSDLKMIQQTLGGINREFGQIDILVNNAGVVVTGEARDFSVEQWRKCFEVNLLGTVNLLSYIYPDMVKRNSGQIVNMASMVGLAPVPLIIPYAASKFGIVGLTRSLRIEAEALGVKINLVCPGRLDTQMLEKSEIVNTDRETFMTALPLKPYPLEKAVNKIISGIIRDRAMIIFPWYVHGLWYTNRISNKLLFPVYAFSLKKFRKLRT